MLRFGVTQAKVQHSGGYGPKICGTSYGLAACMPFWLGDAKFNVIHFNWVQCECSLASAATPAFTAMPHTAQTDVSRRAARALHKRARASGALLAPFSVFHIGVGSIRTPDR